VRPLPPARSAPATDPRVLDLRSLLAVRPKRR
jgi:hypothetical protein